MIDYKPMSFENFVDSLTEVMKGTGVPGSLIIDLARIKMEEQAMVMRFLNDLEQVQSMAIPNPFGPPPIVLPGGGGGSVMTQPNGKTLAENLVESFEGGFKITLKLDDCPKGGDHEWVTWTGLRDTKTDCTKCGALKG